MSGLPSRASRVAIIAVAGALALTACTNDSKSDSSSSSSTSAAASSTLSIANAKTDNDKVNAYIADAYDAFKNPARTSNSGATDKTSNNLTAMVDDLLKASDLAPYRADLLFSAASARINNKDVPGALALYDKILALAPNDLDALTYKAAWTRWGGDTAGADALVNTVAGIDVDRANDIKTMFAAIDQSLATPVTDKAPATSPDAIVVLGYKLKDDGSMDTPLTQRLDKTLELAKAFPNAQIITTGGVPAAGKTEGLEMKNWLVAKGIDAARIKDDNYATSTLQNATFSNYLLAQDHAKNAIVVSSSDHVRRAVTLFRLTADSVLGDNFAFSTVAATDDKLAGIATIASSETLTIYRDSLSAIGLWAFRSDPLVFRN